VLVRFTAEGDTMTDSSYDMRILDELATEIEKHNLAGLPGALRSYLKTKRALHVATVLERVAWDLVMERRPPNTLERSLQATIEHLRDDNQRLTDALLEDSK
jgi:hypothetical protein